MTVEELLQQLELRDLGLGMDWDMRMKKTLPENIRRFVEHHHTKSVQSGLDVMDELHSA